MRIAKAKTFFAAFFCLPLQISSKASTVYLDILPEWEFERLSNPLLLQMSRQSVYFLEHYSHLREHKSCPEWHHHWHTRSNPFALYTTHHLRYHSGLEIRWIKVGFKTFNQRVKDQNVVEKNGFKDFSRKWSGKLVLEENKNVGKVRQNATLCLSTNSYLISEMVPYIRICQLPKGSQSVRWVMTKSTGENAKLNYPLW